MEQDTGTAELLGLAGEGHHLAGGPRVGAGDHRHPPGGGGQRGFQHLLAFRRRQGVKLTGAAQRDEPVNALLDLVIHKALEFRQMDLPVSLQRRDEGGEYPAEAGRFLFHG